MGILLRLFDIAEKRLNIPYCAAVVPAAGFSERMKDVDKLFLELDGVPVLAHTLMSLQNSPYIKEIVISVRDGELAAVADMCERYSITKAKQVVCGGSTRLESVFNGVCAVSKKAKLIAVHDGARPFVSEKIIADTVRAAAMHNAAAPAIGITDTVKLLKDGFITQTLDRTATVRIQTPQVFNCVILKGALINALKKGIAVTDECMAAEEIGVYPYVTEGSAENIKITVPEDIETAKLILKHRKGSK